MITCPEEPGVTGKSRYGCRPSVENTSVTTRVPGLRPPAEAEYQDVAAGSFPDVAGDLPHMARFPDFIVVVAQDDQVRPLVRAVSTMASSADRALIVCVDGVTR